MEKKKVMDEIGKVISNFKEVEAAYTFGSFLESDKFKDVDIALLLSKELPPYRRFKFAMKVARDLERKIKPRFEFDVKLLNYSPVEFQHEVLRKGRVVFSRREAGRVEYESRLISTYLDLKEMYAWLDRKFLAGT